MTSRTRYTGSSHPVPWEDSGATEGFGNQYDRLLGVLFDAAGFPLTSVGGTADDVTATLDPVLGVGGLVDGMKFTLTWALSNTGPMTLALNGGSPVSIFDDGGNALGAGIVGGGQRSFLEYIGGAFRLISGNGGKPGDMPVGAILDYGGSAAPLGWALCQGQAVSRATFSNLFSVLGTAYGVGDGASTFNLPDLRSRVSVGLDGTGIDNSGRFTNTYAGTDGTVLGASGGSESHQLTEAEMPSHDHGMGDVTSGAGSNTGDLSSEPGSSVQFKWTKSRGGDDPHANVQPFLVMNKIIKT